MTSRRVTRFRARVQGRDASFLRRLQLRGGMTLLVLATSAIALLLLAVPFLYTFKQLEKVNEEWGQPIFLQVDKVESHWMSLPRIPAFTRGDEPGVRAFLQDQPLVVALQDRFDRKPMWVRQGNILVKAKESPEVQSLRKWFTLAEQTQRFACFPQDNLQEGDRPGPKIVLLGDRWILAKWWREGSPEVERTLRRVLHPDCRFRFGLLYPGDELRAGLEPRPWGAEPNLQADPARLMRRLVSTELSSNQFQGWTLVAVPFRAEERAIRKALLRKLLLSGAVSLLVGGCLGLGLWLRFRARQKAALDADRLASMTHSLKTPLAILKFRCDTIRLGRLTQDQMDAQLIQLGEEVDRLSDIIENGLMAIQGMHEAAPRGEVTPRWIQGVVDDLAPAFQAESRRLVLLDGGGSGRAPLPSLRAALLTLLENGLYHGKGTVTLETERLRRKLAFRVSDEGPGLPAHHLAALGRPYLRLRKKGKEGFQREGQGLGLSLLCKVAEREGWGLTFASEPGKGLAAVLEIPGA
jgi:signal transduction histidine kinase